MAIQIVREVSADVVKRGATRAVYAKQNDKNSRFLNIRIQEEGKDIKVDSTSTVMLNVERPDHQENIFYGTVNDNGTVRVPLASWMLELEGTLLCDVSIVEEGSDTAKLTTMQFNIYVEEAVVTDESFIDTEEYSVIVDLLNRTDSAAKKAEGAAAAVIGCEEAAIKANEAADKANAVREEVEAGGFVESLKEQNNGNKFSVWVGSLEEYESIETKLKDCLYIINEDKTLEEIQAEISKLQTDYIVEQGVIDGWTYRKWASGMAEMWLYAGSNETVADDPSVIVCQRALPFSLKITNELYPIINVSGYHYQHAECYITLAGVTPHDGVTSGLMATVMLKCIKPDNIKGYAWFNFYVMGMWK